MRERELEVLRDQLLDVGASNIVGVGDLDDFEDLQDGTVS